jgi:hypothetical protein
LFRHFFFSHTFNNMAQQSRPYELILLGATGYTGKLVAEWITTHLPDDLKWAVAGRNAKKLQAVVDELTKLRPDRKQPGMWRQNLLCKHVIELTKPSHRDMRA